MPKNWFSCLAQRYLTALLVSLTATAVVGAQQQAPSSVGTGALPAPDWSLQADGGTELAEMWTDASGVSADKAPHIAGIGPATEIRTTAPAFLLRSRWQLSGTYMVAATFRVAAGTRADIGVLIGGGALACVVAADGTAAFTSRSALSGKAAASDDGFTARAPIRVEVRVTASEISCSVNGLVRARHAADASAAGVPGIYVGTSAAVQISGLTIEASALATGHR